jgi:hypothetical protein
MASAPEEEGNPQTPEQPNEEGAGQGAAAEGPAQELQPVDVYAVLRLCIAQLSAVAWQKMGLQPDPFTNAIDKDVEQAKSAIDATAALVGMLLPKLQGQEARDYQNLLTDLRMNFLRQGGEAGRG